jgi:hypothetical protein
MTKPDRRRPYAPPPPDDGRKAKEAEAIFNSLIKHHSLSTPYHRALAGQITQALMRGDLDRASRAIALLPSPRAIVDHSPTVSASTARQKLTELVLNACAAHQMEEGRDESAEIAALKAQVESLQDECRHLRGSKPRQLPPPTRKPMAGAARSSSSSSSTSAPSPASAPSQPQRGESTTQAYYRYMAAGGAASAGLYGPVPGSDGLPAAGWISRLSQREW